MFFVFSAMTSLSFLFAYRAEFAKLCADSAARTERIVDARFFIRNADGRTADLHEGPAADAFVLITVDGSRMLHVFKESAGASRYDDGRFIRREFLFYGLVAFRKIIRIHHADSFDADSAAEAFEIDLRTGIAF